MDRRGVAHRGTRRLGRSVWLACAWVIACGTTSQDQHEFALVARGQDLDKIELAGGTQVSLVRAQLAFGPLWLCAGTQAGDLCDTARAEWRDAAVVDLLSAEPQELGTIVGLTGPVRSYMYDLGWVSTLARDEPLALEATDELGNTSLLAEGTVQWPNGELVPLEIRIAVRQTDGTEQGQPVVRKSSSDEFFYDIDESTEQLMVAFDLRAWFGHLDEGLLRRHLVCTDANLGGMGGVHSPSDPAPTGQPGGLGGSASEEQDGPCRVVIDEASEAGRGFTLALTAGDRPKFTWQPR